MEQILSPNRYREGRPFPPTQPQCVSCPRRSQCLTANLGHHELVAFSERIARARLIRPGEQVVTIGESFKGIFIVKSGSFKSSATNAAGELQVSRFHLPVEMFGLEGLASGFYEHTVEALDTGTVCRIPFSALENRGDLDGTLFRALIAAMSEMMAHDNELIFALSKMNAQRRLATFLIDMSVRLQRAGFNEQEMTLCMKRTDIGNYLGLAEETVCRLFTRFQAQGILDVNRRYIKSYNLEKLRMIAQDDAGCPVSRIPRVQDHQTLH